ncbi:pentatricopeptide repeat-containing protein At5g42310, mitochondrial [Amborella trichopoda]|nr:pentatricopeptide repeat-containing protein At5g42310, mitochondrial [Amborella trichopoda]XP_020517213.1 pentatricopeptide repeat-containing protein At5g42310, mitochondrial [Amborella trichopoda]XP_020517214.1 pentatricopeptide repeat-containing protein At5g42310, mitochondrial [Amborella trichopoda]XP_020517215.1 pentatricopeptide repeat-containing protein At5g42310, mitochondrial [Amborella trichopoda]XP_020517216.1 pentatricopeptide repeat-containing protein At5g42310, mitochondrial [Am|eukprot:XP_006828751.2 pentatricopeptide repeat-containing protein At5g42310, mitochondrial [Amborella trichopoda]
MSALLPASTSASLSPSPLPSSSYPTSPSTTAPPLSATTRPYDFQPLLSFLSSAPNSLTKTASPVTTTNGFPSENSSASISAATLMCEAELRLVSEYRAVPAGAWHSLLRSLCAEGNLSAATELVSWVARHNLCFSQALLHSVVIHALGRAGQLRRALRLASDSPLPLSPLTLNSLLAACAQLNLPAPALRLLSVIRRHGLLPDPASYSVLVQAMRRSKAAPRHLLNLFHKHLKLDLLEPDSQLLNDLALAFALADLPSHALDFVSLIQSQGLSPKVSTLIALISALADSGQTIEAEAVFYEAFDSGLRTHTRAYNALLKAYLRAGWVSEAEALVSKMEEEVSDAPPDTQTYALLAEVYARAGRHEGACIVLREMEHRGLPPNPRAFSRLLAAYRDMGEWQRVFSVLREAQRSGVIPDRRLYNVAIDALGRCGDPEQAARAFKKMQADGVEPDGVTWNTIIDCYRRAGMHERALDMFKEMESNGVKPCVTTFNIALNTLGEMGRWGEVEEVVERMRADRVEMNVITYTTLVDVYGKAGRFKEAIQWVEGMRAAGMQPSPSMYHALLNSYAQKGLSDQAVNVFKVMRADGLKSSVLVLNLLINAFGEDRRDADAFAVLEFMKENDLKPDVVTYTTLMKALIRAEKFDKVPDVYEEMILSGCTPDRKARGMLRSALRYMKQTLD